jgi:hypothetical protein
MEYPKIEWEDFQDGSGSKTQICVRMLIGDKYANDECYNKRWFTVSVGRSPRAKFFKVVFDSNPKWTVNTRLNNLDDAKLLALTYLATSFIPDTWLTPLLVGAQPTATLSAVL